MTVLTGIEGGTYPHGNSILVSGADQTVLIDPSLSIVEWGGIGTHSSRTVDSIALSHVHEDHVPGLSLYPDVPVWVHEGDRAALASVEALVSVYGLPAEAEPAFARSLLHDYHFTARPDAQPFAEGDVIDVGGSTITVVHTPGHTPGHCCLFIEPEGVLYLGDIELTGFGPYYADRESSLSDFEASIARCREIEAEWYVTFHHKGTYTDRQDFITALDAFGAAIDRRDAALVEFLREPRTLGELVEHRFLYRPHVDLPWVDAAETRTITQHLDRLVERGAVVAIEPDRWRTV